MTPHIAIILPSGEQITRPLDPQADEGCLLTIGRSPDCDIVIALPSVSGSHAIVVKTPAGFELRDNGSTNGLLINRNKEDFVLLKPGVNVLLGEAVLRYVDGEEGVVPPPPPAPETAGALPGDRFDKGGHLPYADASGNIPIPPVEPLRYDKQAEADLDDEDAPIKPVRIVAKSYYMTIALYCVIMFALAFAAGLIYKHYARTGEFLPYRWIGIETPKQKVEKDKLELQEAVRKLDNGES